MSNALVESNHSPPSGETVYVQAERLPVLPSPPAEVHEAPATMPVACGKLSAAIAMARDRCKMAVKDKTNSFHKYSYASADEVILTAKDALEHTGLAIIPHKQKMTVQAVGKDAFYALDRTIFLAHSSGEYVPLTLEGWPVVLERGKTLDKAFATALTTSLSYMLRDLLQMPRGDEADFNARNDTHAEPAPKPVPPVRPTQYDLAADLIAKASTLDALKTAWLERCKYKFTEAEAAALQTLKDQRKAALTPPEPVKPAEPPAREPGDDPPEPNGRTFTPDEVAWILARDQALDAMKSAGLTWSMVVKDGLRMVGRRLDGKALAKDLSREEFVRLKTICEQLKAKPAA